MGRKNGKITLIQAILIIVVILALIFRTIFFVYYIKVTHSNITSTTGLTSTTTIYLDTKKHIPKISNVKYKVLSSSYYGTGNLENLFVTSNEELKTYLLKCFSDSISGAKTQEQNQIDLLNQITVNEQPVLTFFDEKFFENSNLAIQMYDESSSHHHYSIVSITKEKTNGTINIKDNYHKYGGTLAISTHINFIILDKSINNVNYDIYSTTVNNNYDTEMFLMAGFFISISVITIVLMLVVKHNRKIDNSSQNKKVISKIVFVSIIGILFFIVIFFTSVAFEALETTKMIVY